MGPAQAAQAELGEAEIALGVAEQGLDLFTFAGGLTIRLGPIKARATSRASS